MVRLDSIRGDDPEAGLPPSPSYSPSIEGSPPLRPVFLGEISTATIWKRKVLGWIRGPTPPVRHKINPLFPHIQAFPLVMMDRFFPKRKQKMGFWLFGFSCWLLAFVLIEHFSRFVGESSVQLSCQTALWHKNNQCSLDGMDCRPFVNSTITFRCPGNCESEHVLNPRGVGDQEINYRSFVVGGGSAPLRYRADSFICPAAIHAGVINENSGGCGRLIYTGTQPSFSSSKANGIESVEFDAAFPFSYTFEKLVGGGSCTDQRWTAFAFSLTFTILISLLTTNPTVFFGSIFVVCFFQTAMATDPPFSADPYTLVSIAMARFLPTAFTAVVIERWIIRPTLVGLEAQIEKTILWLGACWFGALNNYTFDVVIPISRLTPRDLEQQPGAKAALALIITILLVIAVVQALHIRREGTMPRYLALYGTFILVLLLFVAMPGLSLRIHHYILALLLLPGTRMQTRPSLLWQGLLVGLFINGLARWGWDGILQTDGDLRGDGLLFSSLPMVENVTVETSNVTLSWAPAPWPWDSVSVLVNDVERYRGKDTSFVIQRRLVEDIIDLSKKESPEAFTSLFNTSAPSLLPWVSEAWDNSGTAKFKRDQGQIGEREKLYVRLGYTSASDAGDFSRAMTIFPNGTYKKMKPGHLGT